APQTHRNETGDHNGDGNQECPPDIVVSLLLLEPLRFSFITQPTKRCLSLLIGEATNAERVAGLGHAAAFKLGAPCSFHLWFGHSTISHALLDRSAGRFCCIAHPIAAGCKLTFYTGF